MEEAILLEPRLEPNLAVQLGHAYLLRSPWAETNAVLPKEINFFERSGWLKSVHESVPIDRDGRPIPWWTYSAIEFIEMRIEANSRVFEWGSGNSTKWWASRVAAVHAIEHDPGWHAQVSATLPDHVTLSLKRTRRSYVEAILEVQDAPWDIVVIDGEFRSDCARLTTQCMNPSGILIFDNTDCPEHRDGVVALMDAGWKRLDFFGLVPSHCYTSCTSVFYKDDRWVTCSTLPCESKAIL